MSEAKEGVDFIVQHVGPRNERVVTWLKPKEEAKPAKKKASTKKKK
tara:strand:+ start:1011 stop:1148 length:138 start_codon:yes stop_codon:yes gene_type:complete